MRRFRKPTEGERARLLAFFLCGFCSAGLGYLAVLHLDRAAMFNGLSLYQTWIVVASGIGGLAALFFSGDRLGQSGAVGARRGVAGAIWVTFIGALIGGTLSLPFYGTMFGPLIVCVTLMGAPILAMLWVVNLLGIHMLLGIHQRERDSIFTPERMRIPGHSNETAPRSGGRFI
ncbi:hypothetical protein Q4555_02860 [Octadecabacter sp. 1_MG-2023]|uniref:hypothetical protein n=1 Tax=unclassified Octadecabacter TaxID=196158 RepID=UPI0020901CA4|nr:MULTISPECIES: hypothetical protein [unclassified Octadecabacter]MDO6733592.1 hypothetical protein [Octadecabacter sp. 1_MG-2023]